jgi:hypothetical protein
MLWIPYVYSKFSKFLSSNYLNLKNKSIFLVQNFANIWNPTTPCELYEEKKNLEKKNYKFWIVIISFGDLHSFNLHQPWSINNLVDFLNNI